MKLIVCSLTFFLCLGYLTKTHAYNEDLDPKSAITRLMAGNERFVKEKTLCPARHEDRRAITASQQRPFAVILGCSDSRIPPELAFDQGIGDIFVVRVAGNVVGATELESIEYSVLHNNSVIVLVMGHTRCGAVSAVFDNQTQDIKTIAQYIEPTVTKLKQSPNATVDEAIKANVLNSVSLVKASPAIAKLIDTGKVEVKPALYDIETGKVILLNEK